MIWHCFIGKTKHVWKVYVALNEKYDKTKMLLIEIEYNLRM